MRLWTGILMSVAIAGCSGGESSKTPSGTSGGSVAGTAGASSSAADPELDAVREVVAKHMQVPKSQLADDVPIGKMKPPLDDLDLVEIIMELEDRFKITISDAAMAEELGGPKVKVSSSPFTLKSFAKLVRQAKKPK